MWGLLSRFHSAIFCRSKYQIIGYLLNITFIFDRYHHCSAVVTPVKYEHDLNNLNTGFCNIQNTHNTERLLNEALIKPVQLQTFLKYLSTCIFSIYYIFIPPCMFLQEENVYYPFVCCYGNGHTMGVWTTIWRCILGIIAVWATKFLEHLSEKCPLYFLYKIPQYTPRPAENLLPLVSKWVLVSLTVIALHQIKLVWNIVVCESQSVKSLAPGRCGSNFKM